MAAIPLFMAAGAAMSAIGAAQSAAAQEEAAMYNARFNQSQAVTALDQATAEASRFETASRRTLGSARAGFGATGNVGDALSVLADMETDLELDRSTILYHGQLKALGFKAASGLDTMSARHAAEEGVFRSASALLSGAGNVAVYSAAGSGGLNRAPAGSISNSFLTKD